MMHALSTLVPLALLFVAQVRAGVFVVNPVQSSTCTGGASCEVDWTDDGNAPTLDQIGSCNVGLYTGNFQLVQSLPSVDVSTTSSLSFTPDSTVGADGQYYIVFSSNTINYTGYSASFGLNGMTGTTPSGGSSATTPTATNTKTGSATSAGSSTSRSTASGSTSSSSSVPATSLSSSATTSATLSSLSSISGTATNTTTSTLSTSITGTSTVTNATTTAPSTTVPTSTTIITSTTRPSATPSSAAVRVGSTSLGGVAALLVLCGILTL